MQTGAPLYNKDKIKKKKNALPTWRNLDGWTLNKQFFLFGLNATFAHAVGKWVTMFAIGASLNLLHICHIGKHE